MVCAELNELRAECARQPADRRQLLARIEAEARARRPILDLLGELLGAGREGTRQMLAVGLPGLGLGQADEESFGCPDGVCDRVGTSPPAGPIPRCPLIGQPMSRR